MPFKEIFTEQINKHINEELYSHDFRKTVQLSIITYKVDINLKSLGLTQ